MISALNTILFIEHLFSMRFHGFKIFDFFFNSMESLKSKISKKIGPWTKPSPIPYHPYMSNWSKISKLSILSILGGLKNRKYWKYRRYWPFYSHMTLSFSERPSQEVSLSCLPSSGIYRRKVTAWIRVQSNITSVSPSVRWKWQSLIMVDIGGLKMKEQCDEILKKYAFWGVWIFHSP